ncbi:MAG: addiction module toxin, HicA family [Armatimonadetes bacterium]|nr:addiction module toxin, HicA family [Armatimonadota bacterium]
MADVPVLNATEVIGILLRLGSRKVRRKGPHRQYRHADGRGTTVRVHQGRDISPILLRAIAAEIGMRVEEFLHHR